MSKRYVSVQNEQAGHGVVLFVFGPSYQICDNKKGDEATLNFVLTYGISLLLDKYLATIE